MLSSIIGFSLRHPRLIVLLSLIAMVAGAVTLEHANYDVFPDFVPAQAEVQTEAPGLSAEQVETLVTRPIEQAVSGAAGVTAVRSDSIQGLSIVHVIFKEGADPYRSRQIVSETLGEAAASLPLGVKAPKVSPLMSSTMDLLKVGFQSETKDPVALRDWVQWTLRPRLMAVPGVARATVYGGYLRRYEVQADPILMAARHVTFDEVVAAARAATAVNGGGFIDTSEQRILIEPSAQPKGPDEIAAAPVRGTGGKLLRIGDIAKVVEAEQPRFGDAVIMGKPGVLISLSSQYGANTLKVTRDIEVALDEIEPSLAPLGIKMIRGLHRPANFIEAALSGIAEDLVVGAALIALILVLFMRNVRTVIISFVSIPLSLMTAIMVMDRMGLSINTMTLGGLAVALGVVVDDAVIDVENIIRHLRQQKDGTSVADIILKASLEVRAPIVYATIIVIVTLLPVLMMHGLQGSFFIPLAVAFSLATLVSLVVAVVITPALSLLMLSRAHLPHEPAALGRLKDWHERVLTRLCARPWGMFGAAGVLTVLATVTLMTFGSELLPTFREGHFVLGVGAKPGTSLDAMRRYGEALSKDLMAVEAIDTVEQQIGRAEGGEDTWGPERSEFHIELKPGLPGKEIDATEEAIQAALDKYPGLDTEVMTFLGDRIGESLTGETAALAINLYGADAVSLEQTATQVLAAIQTVDGIRDPRIQTPPRTPSLHIDVDFARAGRRGVSAEDIMTTIQGAYQGIDTAQLYRNDRIVDIVTTLPDSVRDNPEAVGKLLVRGRAGVLVPLADVADISLGASRTVIAHNGGRLVVTVTANPKPVDVAAVTARVKAAVAEKVKLPTGAYIDYVSVADDLIKARTELLLSGLLAIVGIIAVLSIAFTRGSAVVLVLTTLPFAMIGGVVAVALTGSSQSLGSLVGFVTLFGIAARNAIMLISHTDQLLKDGLPWNVATLARATRERVTPILMTSFVTALGLLPLAFEAGQAGREIQGPMAIVILGGLTSAMIMSVLVLPAMMWRLYPAPEVDQQST